MGDKSKCIDFINIVSKHDFVLLTETWTSSCPDIDGYSYFAVSSNKKDPLKINNGRTSGGLAFLFKDCYKNNVDLIKTSDYLIWCKISRLSLGNESDLFICGLYIPPDNSKYFQDDIFEQLEEDIVTFSKQGNVLLLGDFNARVGTDNDIISKEDKAFIVNNCSDLSLDSTARKNFDFTKNTHGKRLLNICKIFDLRILNGRTLGDSLGKTTYHGKNGISTVDYIITDQNLLQNVKYFIVDAPNFLSDHSPIYAWLNFQSTYENVLQDNKIKTDNLKQLAPQYIWSANSVEPFQQAMSSPLVKCLINEFLTRDFSLDGKESINNAVHCVQNIFDKAASMSLKLKQVKHKRKKRNTVCNKKWFDYDCKKARKELRKISNQKHSDPLNLTIREEYHRKLKSFKQLLQYKRKKFKDNQLSLLENNSDNNDFWEILKSANEEFKEEKIPPISEQQWINHFKSLHSKKQNSPLQNNIVDTLKQIEQEKDQSLSQDLNCLIQNEEIETAVKLLKNKKAAASDKVRNEMIKHSFNVMLPVYSKLFNLILQSGFYPDTWCVGSLTPIFKSGDRADPSNYRGICVSSCLGKFFSIILNQRLLNFTQKNNILHNSQIGFMPNFRTSDHIFTLRTLIDQHVINKKKGRIYACFIDFKKAFDSIWHDGLLLRLLQYNISGNFYKLIKNLYSKSSCFVKLGSKRTKSFEYTRGVRQGCILSPLLFNLFLNELSISLENSNETDSFYLPNGQKLSSLLYADDLILMSKSEVGLQNSIKLVNDFCSQWQMSVNEKKTKVMIFCKKETDKIKQSSFTLNGTNLEIVKEFSYLGVKISSTGNFSNHQIQSKEKALHAFYKITNITEFKHLKPKLACKLFDSLIKPILTYASEIWGVYQKHDFDKWDKNPVEKVHLRFCKYYLGTSNKASNIASRAELGRFPMKLFTDTFSLKYFNHLLCLPDNSITKQAFFVSQTLHEQNKSCYVSNLQAMLNFYDIHDNLKQCLSNENIKIYSEKMKSNYFKHWKSLLQNSKKLTFYRSFKTDYEVEDYLNIIQNFEQRRQFTKFRISNHKLAIEAGRYSNQYVQSDQRICVYCTSNEIECEMHMLFKCPIYNEFRENFYRLLEKEMIINKRNENDLLQNLMSSNNSKIIILLSKFICKCLILRQDSPQNRM